MVGLDGLKSLGLLLNGLLHATVVSCVRTKPLGDLRVETLVNLVHWVH